MRNVTPGARRQNAKYATMVVRVIASPDSQCRTPVRGGFKGTILLSWRTRFHITGTPIHLIPSQIKGLASI